MASTTTAAKPDPRWDRTRGIKRGSVPSAQVFICKFWPLPVWRMLHCALASCGAVLTVHYLRWCMPPFMRQCWGLPHRLAQCTRPQGRGKLVNAALLSLINEACVNVCCATLLLSQLVGPACVQERSSNTRGRACRPSGKGSGEEGILSGVVPVYLYCPVFNVSVSLGV